MPNTMSVEIDVEELLTSSEVHNHLVSKGWRPPRDPKDCYHTDTYRENGFHGGLRCRDCNSLVEIKAIPEEENNG